MALIYYVFECNLTELDHTPTDEKIKFCCSNVRWASLKEEIERGERLIDPRSIKKIYETFDRNEARSMATEF